MYSTALKMQNYDSIATHAIAFKLLLTAIIALVLSAPDANCQSDFTTFRPIIVLDPGHGGKDLGTGAAPCAEKYITLRICQLVRQLLAEQLPEAQVYLTRETDSFIGLRQRAQFANELDAQLFVSVHCNAVPPNGRNIRGTETYVMGTHKCKENLEVARRENESFLLEEGHAASGFDQISSEILLNHLQHHTLVRSIEFAKILESAFDVNHPGKSNGVKQAGFMVLHQISMPGVLVETGYLSHPQEHEYLCSDEGQRNIAIQIALALTTWFRPEPVYASVASVDKQGRKGIDPTHEEKRSTYKVQLAAFRQDPSLDPRIKDLHGLEIVRDDQVFRVLSGNYHTKSEADQSKEEWHTKGFRDAFVLRISEE